MTSFSQFQEKKIFLYSSYSPQISLFSPCKQQNLAQKPHNLRLPRRSRRRRRVNLHQIFNQMRRGLKPKIQKSKIFLTAFIVTT